MTNTYDAIGRITQRRLGLNSNYDTALTYKPGADGSQTALLATYQNGGDTPYSYEYDANGNITEITQGNVSVTYAYNAANELIRENNGFTNQTVTYAYDNWGNITEKDVYAYTTATDPGTPTQTIPYAYTNSSWGDQLTSYNNQSILYDAMGNPTSYLGQTLTWRGKQLTAAGTTTYEYDENGLRLNKTVNNVSTNYYYNGSVLMSLVTGNDTLLFSYDASGKVVAVNCNGTYYYYLRNGQGDIVKLIDNSGATVVEYSYDTWGKQISCTGSLASTLGALNPFRYRGYVYDEETGFYYLQSRYYDPTTCRFISADVLLSTGQGVLGNNCYAYCLNNPVMMCDRVGHTPEIIDTDDDGNPDVYVYSYTYTYIVSLACYPSFIYDSSQYFEVQITGHVYIYTDSSVNFDDPNFSKPTGFNQSTDLLVIDKTNDNNPTMFAYQAHKIAAPYRSKIVDILLDYSDNYTDKKGERNKKDLLEEWAGHAFFGVFGSKRAQDVDFDNDEAGHSRWYFFGKAAREGWKSFKKGIKEWFSN